MAERVLEAHGVGGSSPSQGTILEEGQADGRRHWSRKPASVKALGVRLPLPPPFLKGRKVKISRNWLDDALACTEGRIWFSETFGDTAVDLPDVLEALYKRAQETGLTLSSTFGWPCWLLANTVPLGAGYVVYQRVVYASWQALHHWCMGDPCHRSDDRHVHECRLRRLRDLIDGALKYSQGQDGRAV